MTTPSVTELPRRLEPTSIDTFVGDQRPLARVVPLHAHRDRVRRSARPHRRRPLRPSGDPGPGGDAA